MKEVNATQFKNDYEYRKALQEFKKGERNKRSQRGSKWDVDKSSKNSVVERPQYDENRFREVLEVCCIEASNKVGGMRDVLKGSMYEVVKRGY